MDQQILITSTNEFSYEMLDNIELENIVQIEYNQNSLKSNFKTLVEYLKSLGIVITVLRKDQENLKTKNQDLEKRVSQLEQENNDQNIQIDNLKAQNQKQQNQIDNNTEEIEKLKKLIKSLQDQIADLIQQLKDLRDKFSGFDQDKILKQIDLLWKEIERLKLFKPSSDNSGQGVDQDALMKLFNEIQNIKENYVLKENHEQDLGKIWDELNKINKNLEKHQSGIDQNTAQNQKHQEQIQDIYSKLKDVNDKIINKVEINIFNTEIDALKKLIQKLAGGSGQNQPIQIGGLSEEDLKTIKDLQAKFDDLMALFQKLQKQVDDNQKLFGTNKITTDRRLDELEKLLKQCAQQADLNNLIGKYKVLEDNQDRTQTQVEDHERKIKEILRMLDWMREQMGGYEAPIGGKQDDGLMQENLSRLRDDLMALLKALKDELDKKVSFDDLWKSEALILEKVDEVAGALMKKLADKQDTKKALIYLEKKINQLYVLITKEGGMKKGDMDALISKRPLFWSCLSCDKNLDDYNGKLGEYKHWAMFPPKETSPERMGRFGKGYQQMFDKQRIKDEKIMKSDQFQSHDHLPQVKQSNGFSNTNYGGFDLK